MFENRAGFTIAKDLGRGVFNGPFLMVDSNRIEECMEFMKKERIKNVEINSLHGFKGNDLNFLKKYDFIEGLSVVDRGVDVSAINQLKGLKKLILTYVYKQEIQFSNLQGLEECSLTLSNNVNSIFDCVSLKYLRINNFKFNDFHPLSKLSKLEWLEIVQSTLVNAHGIENLKYLNKLELNYLSRLKTLEGIETLGQSLEYLMINKCNKIENYNAIGLLTKLRKLVIIDSAKIASLSFMNNLTNMQQIHLNVDVIDGDMTPLAEINKVFFVNKKHFSHTLQQIFEMNNMKM